MYHVPHVALLFILALAPPPESIVATVGAAVRCRGLLLQCHGRHRRTFPLGSRRATREHRGHGGRRCRGLLLQCHVRRRRTVPLGSRRATRERHGHGGRRCRDLRAIISAPPCSAPISIVLHAAAIPRLTTAVAHKPQ